MPAVSIIIPVYNAQDYLRRCLNSVCNQTLKDIEIICVNDCSTDNSLYILQEYAAKYSNMKVIDCKKNGGESVARNIGLSQVTGEYIAFVDNDDEVDLDFYEKLYLRAKETNADIVKGEALIIDFDGQKVYSHLNDRIRLHHSKWFFEYEWWSAIYKTKMVKNCNLLLPEGYPLGGDQFFLHNAVMACQKLELIDGVFYYWLRREGSGDSQILSDKKIDSALALYDKILENINCLYQNSQIDAASYNYLIECNANIGIMYLYRNQSLYAVQKCVKHICDVYQNNFCLDDLKSFLKKKCFLVERYLENADTESIVELVVSCKSVQEFYKKNTLARLRSNVIYA